APFIKVEATKFTEVGYVGRDVESMVRDLVETAIRMVKAEKAALVQDRAREMADERLVEILCPSPSKGRSFNPFGAFLGMNPQAQAPDERSSEEEEDLRARREATRAALRDGRLEETIV